MKRRGPVSDSEELMPGPLNLKIGSAISSTMHSPCASCYETSRREVV